VREGKGGWGTSRTVRGFLTAVKHRGKMRGRSRPGEKEGGLELESCARSGKGLRGRETARGTNKHLLEERVTKGNGTKLGPRTGGKGV